MEYIIDLNVILDFLLVREPYYKDAKTILLACQNKKIKCYLCADSVSTLFYIMHKELHSNEKIYDIMDKLFLLVKVMPLMSFVVNEARIARNCDFEDSLVAYSCKYGKCNAVITRNTKDYKNLDVKVITPEELAMSL